MKLTCQHCQRCFAHREAANAHTVIEKNTGTPLFSSLDDTVGIDICQVCHKPPLLARIWHTLTKDKNVSEIIHTQENSRTEMAIAG